MRSSVSCVHAAASSDLDRVRARVVELRAGVDDDIVAAQTDAHAQRGVDEAQLDELATEAVRVQQQRVGLVGRELQRDASVATRAPRLELCERRARTRHAHLTQLLR